MTQILDVLISEDLMIVRYFHFFQTVAGELYGPVMVVMTLVALLLFSMKHSGHTVVSTIR